jgi:WD40 repeat protein/predicted Ser/Thr protein kinase
MNMPAYNATCTRCETPLDSLTLNGLCPRCVALDFFAPAPPDKAGAETPFLGESERRIGDYELLEEIARGGMGVVYRARQVSLGRAVAVKMLLHGVLAGDNAIARFKAEATAVANLRHPNIVAIHEIGEHQGQHFFSMEFVTGRTLAEKVRDGPLPAKLAATYLQRVAEAVHYAHEHGVLHRDLKPSNVLVDENDQPRVTDFGLAKRAGDDTDLTITGQVIGTPAYMSPEQAGGAKFGPVDARSDIYSLGAVLYHLVTGRAPFTGEAITEILHQATDTEPVAPRLLNPKLPRDLETICIKCLAKEPRGRYASAQALADDLGFFLRGESIAARPAGATEKFLRWCRRKPALATALGACAAILFAGVTGILWQLKQTETARRQAVQKAKDEETQRKFAQQSALVMRQNLYAADVMAAQRALDRNDLGTARLLLNGHRPQPGQEDLRGFEWRYLWQRAQGDKCVVLTNASGPLGAVAFSPDGKWLAFAGKEVTVCDATTFQVRARAKVISESIAFDPSSSALLVGDWEAQCVRRWDWRQNNEPAEFIQPHGLWPAVAVSPAGNVVAVGCGNNVNSGAEGTTTLYDPATGQPRQSLPESGGVLTFSPDGKLLATGAWKNKIKLWNPATGEFVRELTNANLVTAMNFSPDGQMLAVCSATPNSTWIYDVATGAQQPAASGIPCCAWGAAFSPDGTTLATAVTDETVRLWDVKSGQQTACLLGHSYQVNGVAWSPDGKRLASNGTDGTVRLWDIAASKMEDNPITGQVKPGYFSRDGKLVAVKEPDGALTVRELPPLRPIGAPRQIGKYIGFSPDATALLTMRWITNTETSELIWWRLPDFAELKKISLPFCGGPTLPQQLSPDARLLATPGAEGEVQVWDLPDNGKLLARLSVAERGCADALGFSPDGRELVCSFPGAKAGYLWDMKAQHPTREFPGLRGESIQFSRDGKIIFANGSTALTFWETDSGKEIGTTIGRWGGVIYLDLSPDGRTLAFPSNLGVRLWNVVTRREAGLITTPSPIASMAFAPDGNSLFITEYGTQERFTVVRHAPSFAETDSQR